jgi:hypothetical protein
VASSVDDTYHGTAKFTNSNLTSDGNNNFLLVGKSAGGAQSALFGYRYHTNNANAGAFVAVWGDNPATQSLFVKTGGNVGIATSDPQGLLQLKNSYVVAHAPSGNPSGATDLANIMAAIEAVGGYIQYPRMQSSAGTVYLQAGCYYINDPIDLERIYGINIVGAGRGVTIIQRNNATGKVVFNVEKTHDCVIKNLSIRSYESTIHSGDIGIKIHNTGGTHMVDNVEINYMDIGIFCTGGDDGALINSFRDVKVMCCNTGVQIGEESGSTNYSNCNCFYGGLINDCLKYGVRLLRGCTNVFYGVTLESNGNDNGSGNPTVNASVSFEGISGNNALIGCYLEQHGAEPPNPPSIVPAIRIATQYNRVMGCIVGAPGGVPCIYWASGTGANDQNVLFGNQFNDCETGKEVVLSNLGVGTPNPADALDVKKGNIRATAANDSYPTAQLLNYSHDNVSLNFDSYYSGSGGGGWKSSDSGSNFRIYKMNDKLRISYANGVTAGNTIDAWASEDDNCALVVNSGGAVGINTTQPAKKLEIVDSSSAQLRLSNTADSKYVDFQVDTNHNLTIKPTSTGKVILQPTTNSTDFFQVKRQDGTNVVLKVNTTQERVGIKTDPGAALDVNGNFAIRDYSISVTQDYNNFATYGFSVLRLTTDQQRTITGFSQGVQGVFLWVVNVGSNNLILANQHDYSAAENRIITGTGGDLTLSADDIAQLWYDSTTARWRVMSKW